jgi:hypothetical protein
MGVVSLVQSSKAGTATSRESANNVLVEFSH